jgi:hypothetical protein
MICCGVTEKRLGMLVTKCEEDEGTDCELDTIKNKGGYR